MKNKNPRITKQCIFFCSPGYYTGAYNIDHQLQKNGFPGEGITTGEVVASKTHYYGSDCSPKFDKVILLMRHPVGTILADFNRQAAAEGPNRHIGKADPALFNTKGTIFTDDFVMGTLPVSVIVVTQIALTRCINSLLSNNTSLSGNWNDYR